MPVALALSLTLAVPQQQQPPVFRATTAVVPVTVTVLDEKGVPVRDLKASDFTVRENGKVREIVNFFPQPMEPGPAAPPPIGGVYRPRSTDIVPNTRRTFVIVLGCDVTYKSCEGAAEFIRHQLLPQDTVAIMAFHRVTSFSNDREALVRIVERYQKNDRQLFFDLGLARGKSLFGNSKRPKESDVLAAMDAVLDGVGPLRNSADLLFGIDRPGIVEKPYLQQPTFADLAKDLGGISLMSLVMMSNRFKLFAAIEYLRYVEGEKHVVFLNSGGGLARTDDDATIIARRANDAHVVVDMVGPGFSWLSRDVVDQTGGYYSTLEVTNKGLTKLNQATRFSYLLGYAAVDPTLDGKFRHIEVKVNRPGVTVRFQNGYYAAADPDPIEIKDLILKSRLEAALAYDQDSTDISLKAFVSPPTHMGIQTQSRIDLTIDVSALTIPVVNGHRVGQLELQVYCGDAKEIVIGDLSQTLTIDATEAQYQSWQQTGLFRTVRVPFIGEPKFFKVVVYDYGSDKVGTVTVKVK